MSGARDSPGRAIVFGLMFELPYAGIVVQFLHYLIGLRELGWDVWYVEDSGSWPYDPRNRRDAVDPASTIAGVASVLDRHGFGDRWVYRWGAPNPRCAGLGERKLEELYRTTDLALNVTGAQAIGDEHGAIDHLVYVQSDPFGLQVLVEQGDEEGTEQLARHGWHFTFGELVGTPGCAVPTVGLEWLPTRQAVAMSLWPVAPPGERFTTVTTWSNDTKHVTWRGSRYFWSKDRAFLDFADVPLHTRATLELAVDGTPAEEVLMRRRGWHIVDRPELTTDVRAYQHYIGGSRGEFTVARDQFVRPRTGWFSDRSASYLAAGKAVVTQDTGFGDVLPTGEGLFAYSTVEEAAAAVDAIDREPGRHGAAARAIAEEFFAADKVIGSIIDRVDRPR